MQNNQQNSNSTNNSSVLVIPQLSAKEKAIINIIADHIVYNRIEDGVYTILNCFSPGEQFNTLDVSYYGSSNLYAIMDIDNHELIMILEDIFSEAGFDRHDNRKASEAATVIYFKWLNAIKDFFITKKAV